MRIGFDAKRLYNNFTGLGNYSRFVVSSLLDAYPHDEYFLFTPRVKQNADTNPFAHDPRINTVLPPKYITSFKLGSYWRSFLVSKELARNKIEIYHGLSHELPKGIPSGVKTVVTIHDLIFFRYPQFYNPIDVMIYKAKVKYACNVADRIVAISEQTADDVVEFLNIPREKIDVVFQGCHPNFKQKFTPEELLVVRKKYHLPENYILNVGTIEERKNGATLVNALSMLAKDVRIPIVFVGKRKSYISKILKAAQEGGIENELIFLHQTDFRDLPAIYQGAKVFVYPSLFEGFGIPLIEAIESHVPVITSRESCFSEAAGPGSIYIDPKHPEELAFQLEKVLTDKNLASQMVTESLRYVEKFQPAVIGREMHGVYERVLSF